MKKTLIGLIILIMILGAVTTYRYNLRYTKVMNDIQLETSKKIESLSGEIERLKISLDEYKDHHEEEYELRNVLDIKFYDLMASLRSGDEESIKSFFYNDIDYLDNSIKYTYEGESYEYSFDEEDVFRQRFFFYDRERNVFESGYELINTDVNDVLYITYKMVNNQWKIVFIKKDIG